MSSKKKTVAQRAVGLAAPVLPAPVAKVVGTRWGARLFILVVPILFATGVLTVSWNNGIPTLNFDRARAWMLGQQVGQQVGQRVESEALRAAQHYQGEQPQSFLPAQQPAPGQSPQAWQPAPQQYLPQPQYQSQFQPQPQYQPQFQGSQQPAAPQQAAQPFGPRAYR